jgi:hypothetical protein
MIIKEKLYTNKTSDKPYKSWWLADENDVHDHVTSIVNTISANHSDRKYQDLRHAYLYQNRQASDILLGSAKSSLPDRYNVTYNVVKSATDTLTAKITANRPRPRILTEKGDYDKQMRAQKLTQYLDGMLAATGAYRVGTQAFKDACIFGTGVLKVFTDGEDIKVERVLITEIIVDDLEAAYGQPRSMYQARLVSRDALLDAFPEQKQAIEFAAPEKCNASVDMIRVIEAWHLPKNGKNGKHAIVLPNATLFMEDWNHETFPFAFIRYSTNIASFYGQGVSEELMGTQLEINKILRDIQRAQHLIAVPRVLMEVNSKVVASHLNNEIGSAIKYQGTRPDFFTPTAMNNEIYNHVKWLIQSAYEKVGVSQLSASSKKPAGLDSGRAIREYKDNETERFSTTETMYREFYDDLVKLILIFSRELYANGVDPSITAESKKFIETIKWSEVDMDDDKFVSRIQNSSIFPTTPAAKLQKVEEYVRAGWMDRDAAIRLMDFPDIEAWETLETSDRDYMDKILSNILGKGKYLPPEPEMMLDKDINIARKAYIEALNTGADEDKLDLLLRWIEAASSLLPTPPPAPMAAPAVAPLGVPGALPEAGLLPQGPVVPGV